MAKKACKEKKEKNAWEQEVDRLVEENNIGVLISYKAPTIEEMQNPYLDPSLHSLWPLASAWRKHQDKYLHDAITKVEKKILGREY